MKQKTTSFLPKYEEWHVPGYNFNGMYTQIPERFGLKYKGEVGTGSYFLPANKLDRVAMQHDLYYYSPHILSKAYADYEYLNSMGNFPLNDNTKLVSEFAILSQLIRRYMEVPLHISLATGKEFYNIRTWVRGFKRMLGTPYKKGSGSILGWLFNPVKGRVPQILKDFARNDLGVKGTYKGPSEKYRKMFLSRTIPMMFLYGTKFFTKPYDDAVTVWNLIKSNFKESKEWSDIQKANEKVMEKYDNYLKTVGTYDKNEDFLIKDNIDVKKAKRDYISFFKEYRNYIKYINKRYGENIEIPNLNKDNLKMVSFPEMQKTPVIKLPSGVKEKMEQIIKEPVKIIENLSELYENIEKVLVGDHPTPSQSYPEIEPKKYTFTEVEDDESI
jgi:hypothetical protein